MEKSIENIWNKGFLDETKLIVPKINDLYNRKSKLVTDKMKKTMFIDHWSMVPVTIAGLAYLLYLGSIWVSIYFFVLMCLLFIHNRILYRNILKVDQTADSYLYISTFYNFIKKAVRSYTKMFAFLFPPFILPIYWVMFRDKPWYNELLNESIGHLIFYGSISMVALSIIGVAAYRLAVKLVYGRMLGKLKNIIKDMEELRSDVKESN